ncbi:MAG TPA: response regulator transcription factor [Gemmatimonadaceae bacterium]|nr:response regulator transcription factor [Gemmatimonadaceae bacterium]
MLACDHAIVRNGIAQILNGQPGMAVVAQAADGVEAVTLYATERPDVAMIDLRMPRLDGVHVVERIRTRFSEARIAIMTTYDTDDHIDRALRAGAKAVLLKDAAPHELVACVRAVYAGQMWVARSVGATRAERGTRMQLTAREMVELRLLATGKSNREIAGVLAISDGTVKIHLAHLFEKLGVGSRTEAIATAVRRGLVRMA